MQRPDVDAPWHVWQSITHREQPQTCALQDDKVLNVHSCPVHRGIAKFGLITHSSRFMWVQPRIHFMWEKCWNYTFFPLSFVSHCQPEKEPAALWNVIFVYPPPCSRQNLIRTKLISEVLGQILSCGILIYVLGGGSLFGVDMVIGTLPSQLKLSISTGSEAANGMKEKEMKRDKKKQ